MRNYSENLKAATNSLMKETDEFMTETLNLVPSAEILTGIDPKTFEAFQKALKLSDSSRSVVAAQLEYYEAVESKLDEILAELKELKQLQATKVAKEK